MGFFLANGSPPKATVAVDGVPKGKLGEAMDLTAGKHLVEITAPGFFPYRQRVEIAAGGTITIHADLAALQK
jgi:hypothetical protein